MEGVLIVIIILLALGLLGALRRGVPQPPEVITRSDLQTQIESLRGDFSNSLSAQRMELNQALQSVQTIITASGESLKSVGTQLGTLGEAAKQIQEIGKDISSLQEILAPPKLRGELGEHLLENLLAQCLPKESFRIQHVYTNGTRVDALICLAQGRIPVDSKFPVESFRRLASADSEQGKAKAWHEFERDVRKHVDNVAGYIRTDEGTLDFALMYIPAESVYYEIAVRGTTSLHYAREKRVFPVSPNLFYAYLQTIALGLRGLQIEKRAAQIYSQVRAVEQILAQFYEEFGLVGRNIRLANEHYQDSARLVVRVQDRLSFLGQEPSPSLPQLPGEQG